LTENESSSNGSSSNNNNSLSGRDVIFGIGLIVTIIAVAMAIGSIIYAVYTASIADTLLTREFNGAMNKVGSWGIASAVVLIIGKILVAIGKIIKIIITAVQ
jgi:uncharacterized membrane protein